MKKFLIFSTLAVCTFAFSACTIIEKKEKNDKKEEKAPSQSHHRRYQSQPSKDN
jgi:hypothetical protein